MPIITLILITIFIPTVQLARPTIKLTFTPDEKYMSYQQQVEIRCELINPNQRTDTAQLWHLDLKTDVRTYISRSLLTAPTADAPEIFKFNRNQRYEYLHKNQIRIRGLRMEDSARYECNCPDCDEPVVKQTRDLLVMQLREPEWRIESGWPLHENTRAVVKCHANDFYPYVNHRILRDNQEITTTGKSTLSSDKAFPQTFVWETTITPTAEWHNSTLRCSITEGSTQQETMKTLDVLFAARFLQCAEQQHVDPKREQSTIECAYSGNPRPELLWLRQSDLKPITADNGIKTSTKDDNHGRYRSIITFDRNRLASIPISSNNGQANPSGDNNYYQQLLNKGFLVKLTVNGNEKATRNINIVRDAKQIRTNAYNHSIVVNTSSSIFFILLILLHMIIQR